MTIFFKKWDFDWRAYLAEFLGTFVFVVISSGAILSNVFFGDVGILGVALATGLSLSAMMHATQHISGGHLNPAVTLALWLAQKLAGATAFFYILAQVAASLAAAEFLLFIYGERALEFSLGAPKVATGEQIVLLVEVFLTAVLVFAVFATLVDKQGQITMGPLVVGLVVVVATIMAGSLSGAVLNPARVIGPLMVSNSYDHLAVWIVGPAVGGLFGIVYEWLFGRKSKKFNNKTI